MKNRSFSRMFALMLTVALLIPTFVTSATAQAQNDEYVVQLIVSSSQNHSRSDETPIGQVIKEKFNIVFEYLPINDDSEKQSLMLATGDYPEILRLEGGDMVRDYIGADALVCLDDYIASSTYFKQRYAEQIPYWRASSEDGKIFTWQRYVPSDLTNAPEILDIGVRTDVLEQQSWPNLVSEDEWISFLQKALLDNPETNGQRTVGMVLPLAESWGPSLLAEMVEKGGVTNDQGTNDAVIWNQVDQKWVPMWTLSSVIDSYRFFNRLYHTGILDPDCFTDTYDQVQEKIDSGRALSVWYCTWMSSSANATLVSNGFTDMQYINMPVRSNAQVAAGLKREIRMETTRPFDSYAITTNAKYPDRLFAFLDWALSDEGQILLQSGIEGTHYTIVDGKRSPTLEYISGTLTDPNYYNDQGFDLASFFGACKQGDDQGIAFNLQAAPAYYDEIFLTDRQKEAYQALGWSNSLEYWLETGELAPSGLAATCVLNPDSAEGKQNEKFKAWIAIAATKLVIAEDFDATWNELNKEYEAMGINSIVDKYNEILQINQERYTQYMTTP
ncbi:MAG: extracellular solute-binding protein [Anaerolineae bacterium]|nr:extracellular solute-binding protein [Anaerolineae bacterium]